jgi:hypothetical protein
MVKDFNADFYKFYAKIRIGENFAFTRFSDGELHMLQGKPFFIKNNSTLTDGRLCQGYWGNEELKSFDPDKDQKCQDKLIECFKHREYNYFKGICCKCCVGEKNWKWQFENLLEEKPNDEFLTWSNLFINGNYEEYMSKIVPLFSNIPIIIVCNENSDISGLPFYKNIIKWFPVGSNCHSNNFDLIEEMKVWSKENDIQNHMFLFSAASLSNYLIYELYKQNNNNTYFDIGSTLNPMMKLNGWVGSRAYLLGYWTNQPNNYSVMKCVWGDI